MSTNETKINEFDERLSQIEKAVGSNPPTKKTKFGIKSEIPVGNFIGFVASLIWFVWFYTVVDIRTFKIAITAWCGFWLVLVVLGFNKGSIMEFASSIVKILLNKEYTNDEKIGMIMNLVQTALGIVADLSQIVTIKKKIKPLE